jgi:hypothetical protein
MNIRGLRGVAIYMAVVLFFISVCPRADAGFSPSEVVGIKESDRSADLRKIRQVLEMKSVRDHLQALGLSDEEAGERLSALSDSQIHQLSQNLEQVKIGGDGFGVVIALLVIAILVVLLLQLTGHRVIVR